MIESNRVTRERLEAAVKAAPGIRLTNSSFYTRYKSGEECACGLSMVVLAECPAEDGEQVRGELSGENLGFVEPCLIMRLGVPEEYIDGYVDAFDGGTVYARHTVDYLAGFEDGLEGRAVLFSREANV